MPNLELMDCDLHPDHPAMFEEVARLEGLGDIQDRDFFLYCSMEHDAEVLAIPLNDGTFYGGVAFSGGAATWGAASSAQEMLSKALAGELPHSRLEDV